MLNFFKKIFKRESTNEQPTDKNESFFLNYSDIKKLDFKYAVKRVLNQGKGDLLFEPFNYCDVEWMIANREKEFKQMLFKEYQVAKPIIFDMPKKPFAYRPISYLQPLDSILYQTLVDQTIKYTHINFSKQVYSNIINKITKPEVFDNPVSHWLKMRDSLRYQHAKGANFYFFCDISGYFENIKIQSLLKRMKHYVGRNEIAYLKLLSEVLKTWQYADAQGIVQPHNASSILGKIYLAQVDSAFRFLGKNYHRYVDEFHIMAKSEEDLREISIQLSRELRQLGLNLNISKSKSFKNDEILVELDKDKDFFDSVKYTREILKDFELSNVILTEKFEEILLDIKLGRDLDSRAFRYIIRKWQLDGNPKAINSCLEIFVKYVHLTVDITLYLRRFINEQPYEQLIFQTIFDFLNSAENIYPWQQVWFLALLFENKNQIVIDSQFLWDIVHDQNQDELSIALAYLLLAKNLESHELFLIENTYYNTSSTLIKRAILFCMSKFTKSYKKTFYEEKDNDDLLIKFTKFFLRETDFNIDKMSILNF
ncbi:hypothetical protein HUU42_11555 [bacterium]|nr:hypothetical protein [bacterium]